MGRVPIVVLDFFAYWCPPCQGSSPELAQNVQTYYAARGGNPSGLPVVVMEVNIEAANPALTDAFVRQVQSSLVVDNLQLVAYSQFPKRRRLCPVRRLEGRRCDRPPLGADYVVGDDFIHTVATYRLQSAQALPTDNSTAARAGLRSLTNDGWQTEVLAKTAEPRNSARRRESRLQKYGPAKATHRQGEPLSPQLRGLLLCVLRLPAEGSAQAGASMVQLHFFGLKNQARSFPSRAFSARRSGHSATPQSNPRRESGRHHLLSRQ